MIDMVLYMIFGIVILFFIVLTVIGISVRIMERNIDTNVYTENGILTVERAKKLKFSRR